MFTERSKLTEKRTNPFYGSYKDSNILEEIHWQNRLKLSFLWLYNQINTNATYTCDFIKCKIILILYIVYV